MSELPQLLVLTGLSGAGRSTGAKVLEDLGFYVIDNLPPGLLRNVVDLNDLLDTPRRLAVVVDTRGGFPVTELEDAITELEATGIAVTVLFLDADDEVLIRRYEEHRRPHPVGIPARRRRRRPRVRRADDGRRRAAGRGGRPACRARCRSPVEAPRAGEVR